MRTITIGVDLAKLLFSICEVDASGRVLHHKDLRRAALADWLAQLPAGTIVAKPAAVRTTGRAAAWHTALSPS